MSREKNNETKIWKVWVIVIAAAVIVGAVTSLILIIKKNSEKSEKAIAYNIISLGSSGVGKTSIFKRLLNEKFEHLLRKRAIRSLSGIVSVQVLTKPRPCP